MALSMGTGVGALLLFWALQAQDVGRLDPSMSIGQLAVRYVGVSAIIAGAVGLLAPTLREPRPASVYAGVCGAVFALVAASLVAELQWFIGVAMASVGFPVGWFTFRSEVQGAARFLCGAEESSGCAENPNAKSGDGVPMTDE